MLSKWGKNFCQISLVKFPIVHYKGSVHRIAFCLFVCFFGFFVTFLPPLGTGFKFKTFPFPFCLFGFFFFFGKYLNTSILLSMVQHIPMLEKCRSTEKPLQTDVTGVLYFWRSFVVLSLVKLKLGHSEQICRNKKKKCFKGSKPLWRQQARVKS